MQRLLAVLLYETVSAFGLRRGDTPDSHIQAALNALESQRKHPGTPRTSAAMRDNQEDLHRRHARSIISSGVLRRVADDRLVETAVLRCEGFESIANGQCKYEVSFTDGQHSMRAMNPGNPVPHDVEG